MSEAQAFVTLATTDAYCMGCIVVGKSLRRHGTTRKLVVMVSPNVSRTERLTLEDVFDEIVVVDVLDSRDKAHLTWLGRPELGVTFTKLHCWTLTQFSKCVFLDADTLVLCNVDELFEYEELSAAPDPGWPDCFNSGVFVFRPTLNTHNQILEHAAEHGSFDGGDQGVLNTFFNDWAVKDIKKHLPFVYNLSASAIYTYLPAFQQYGHHAKIVHFLGGIKPWHHSYNVQAASESSFRDPSKNFMQFLHLWWVEYYSQIKLQVKKDDKNENYSVEQLDSPQTPSQNQKSSAQAHHREMRLSSPHQDLTLDALTISSSDKPDEMTNPVTHPTVTHPNTKRTKTSSDGCKNGMNNILFDVLPSGLTEETLVTPLSEQKSEHAEPETADCSAVATGEATVGETVDEDLEHRRMWEEGHIDYMGKDAFNNIKRKLDLFLD